jgi:uncharacterized protein (DUF2141 family)
MKKSALTILGIIVATISVMATDSNKLTVVVKNMKNTNGNIRITLFDSEDNWLSNGETKISPIENSNEVIIEFENLPNGAYGISVIHDENSNKGLDTGTFGIPTEAYGFSNDARGMFGPASFEDSQFELKEDKQIEINVK